MIFTTSHLTARVSIPFRSLSAGVRALALGIASWYELHLPVPPPPGYGPLTDDEVSKQYQSKRFGSTHVGVFVVCVSLDDALNPDENEIGEAQWLTVEEWVAGGHEHEAAQVVALAKNGTLDAAARLAREIQAGKRGDAATSTSTSPLPASLQPVYDAAVRHLCAGIRVTSKHKRYPGGTVTGVHYTPLPRGDLLPAIKGLPATIDAGVIADAPIKALAEASTGTGTVAIGGGGAAAAACAGTGTCASSSHLTLACMAGGAALLAAGCAIGVLAARRFKL